MERNRRGRPRHPDVLTPAEWRVLDALRDGGTNADIAARLGLSADTVKYHISNMLAKLELRDRRALASWRPEERRGRLGALLTVPAVVWSVARPIAWVGAGTAAVAGVVVGVVAVVALVAVVLVTAGRDADPPLAVAPPPTPESTSTPAPTPTVQPTPMPSPTPAVPPATATATPSPSPTPSATPPAPTSTPSPTPTPDPTSTPSPTVTLLPVIAPLPTREELGIVEVDVTEALDAAGLTHVRYEAGEEVPWDPGLFLLDVATGAVEGWTCRRDQLHGCSVLHISPSNRYLSFMSYVHDRETDRMYADVHVVPSSPHYLIPEIIGWSADVGERLLVRGGTGYTVLDSQLQPAAQRLTMPAPSPAQHGRYVAAIEDDELRIADLGNESDRAGTSLIERALPDDVPPTGHHKLDVGRGGAFLILPGDADSTRIIRYDWEGNLGSDVVIPRLSYSSGSPLLSPRGGLVAGLTFKAATGDAYDEPRYTAVSIFNLATGEEVSRILGAGRSFWHGIQWLGDDTGVLVSTVLGEKIATLDGEWAPSPGRPAPGDPSVHFEWGTAVRDRQGNVLASVEIGAGLRTPDFLPRIWTEWGAHGRELRIRLYGMPPGYLGDWDTPPLAPVIEVAPVGDRLLVEVVAGTCLNVREEASLGAAIVACVPDGTLAETDDYYDDWMHIRTDNGVEGWADADYLRWHSDGVRLEE